MTELHHFNGIFDIFHADPVSRFNGGIAVVAQRHSAEGTESRETIANEDTGAINLQTNSNALSAIATFLKPSASSSDAT